MDKREALKRFFGHSAFRPGQEALIDALLSGRDALGIMPTGAGKSICYQLPATLLSGVTLVISPLISLMQDQVAALNDEGVPAAFLNSSLSARQQSMMLARARAGMYRLIYIAPERLSAPGFLAFAQEAVIPLVIIDEAHCVSQWGQNFRPSYLKIADFIAALKKRPAVGAFTATATEAVKRDMTKLLALKDPFLVTTGFDRPNLYFDVVTPKQKSAYVLDYVMTHKGSGIIYCATRKSVESLCFDLNRAGISATRYHAGLAEAERRQNQEDFIYDRKKVMVATNAFGMGIDKSNVSFVLHYNMPKSIEAYYQEAGRAGRDGEKADCVLLFSAGDVMTGKYLIECAEDNEELNEAQRAEVRQADLERLKKMEGYCQARTCLRQYLLAYFGEEMDVPCGNCGACKGQYTTEDITLAAQKILSGVARIERRNGYGLGVALVIAMLRGSREKRLLELRLNELPTYGALKTTDARTLRAAIDFLITERALYKTSGDYPVLKLGERADEILFSHCPVLMPVRADAGLKLSLPKLMPARAASLQLDSGLLEELKFLRAKLAQHSHVPAYIIFSNAALNDMAQKAPRTIDEFMNVSGVGAVKAERYGKQFLEAILSYQAEREE